MGTGAILSQAEARVPLGQQCPESQAPWEPPPCSSVPSPGWQVRIQMEEKVQSFADYMSRFQHLLGVHAGE
jgi:hypothetical protein